ncbi:Entner-Doudoroff aldolase [Deinococcus aerius]|uniref:Entner-Doudoroff aldolase n=1 Tax=Deinococcus aerius TaxID=200253 RepID=A0A2I9D5X5_9DEIO|nr:bifunctional 4-hydroxy-2-oxoglutarate aldolase/2-dehydro-3-deoxy-phosphogluconate aldolase [Deinococcus aerius]GBF06076.1 Entner-Doudoroff aldolase [Deinococcus aerius]
MTVPGPDVTGALGAARVVGVLRAGTPAAAVEAARASVRAGLGALELTFTTPGVSEALAELRGERVLLGAGTVMNASQAEEAVAAGASFLVSPHLGEDVAAFAREAGVPYLPGVLTPGEVVRALALGVPAVKLFPARALGGPAYLRDLRGPLPGLRVMATGGIEPREVGGYLAAGALAVGLGGQLFPGTALRSGDWEAVEVAVRGALRAAGPVGA